MFNENIRFTKLKRYCPGHNCGLMNLDPNEIVLMDSGKLPISCQESKLEIMNGKLILTNKRLIFEPSRFQSIVGSFRLSIKPDSGYVKIPLTHIIRVERGFMAHLKVFTRDKEYSFKGMRGADKWVRAIEQAVSSLSSSIAPKLTTQGMSMKFCPYCGSPVSSEDIYCGNCGNQLPK